MTRLEHVRQHREEILRLAAEYGAYNVRIFGSVVRGEERPESDVDLLVCMEKGRSLLKVVGFEIAVEDLLGCPVDVSTEPTTQSDFVQRVVAGAIPL